ncbi:hypothetical protein FIU87_07260 [Bacillus sp. THAF10]|uniref:hypothetical protein n=1 Tax=Bacillus sp. THAF10 TaxID=2587848 RepID=UPI0012A951FA|nr:hypothetical protein [Bacillus sp. THAF10]QFT88437.1 hypothetical protein FIU87_07260 [Bacillus sp. THAF10]
MSEFDFGEEHLRFLFDRWGIEEGLGKANNLNQDFISFEEKLNKHISDLEKWLEG